MNHTVIRTIVVPTDILIAMYIMNIIGTTVVIDCTVIRAIIKIKDITIFRAIMDKTVITVFLHITDITVITASSYNQELGSGPELNLDPNLTGPDPHNNAEPQQ
jgi:hypothetical protein